MWSFSRRPGVSLLLPDRALSVGIRQIGLEPSAMDLWT